MNQCIDLEWNHGWRRDKRDEWNISADDLERVWYKTNKGINIQECFKMWCPRRTIAWHRNESMRRKRTLIVDHHQNITYNLARHFTLSASGTIIPSQTDQHSFELPLKNWWAVRNSCTRNLDVSKRHSNFIKCQLAEIIIFSVTAVKQICARIPWCGKFASCSCIRWRPACVRTAHTHTHATLIYEPQDCSASETHLP